jgi:hypothetical protein
VPADCEVKRHGQVARTLSYAEGAPSSVFEGGSAAGKRITIAYFIARVVCTAFLEVL